MDPIGLFSKKMRFYADGASLILPETFPVDVELQHTPDLPDIESDRYSPVRAGDDPSELFGLRDYREGDPLRNIHWKLSVKKIRPHRRSRGVAAGGALLFADAGQLPCGGGRAFGGRSCL